MADLYQLTIAGVLKIVVMDMLGFRDRSLFMTGVGELESNDFLWKIFSRPTRHRAKIFDAHSYR